MAGLEVETRQVTSVEKVGNYHLYRLADRAFGAVALLIPLAFLAVGLAAPLVVASIDLGSTGDPGRCCDEDGDERF